MTPQPRPATSFQTAPPSLGWRLLDGAEAVRAALFGRLPRRAVPWLLLAPALLLVGLLVVALGYMGDASLRLLDRATFLPSEDWSLANYETAFERAVYMRILWRSILAAVIVTIVTLILAFPYAYVMVRTGRPWLRKLLLVGLFLPFFIGQVVRAYGWLILLGQQGLVNTLLGGIGIGPLPLLFTYESVLFGLVQYMLPFAVLLLAPAITAIGEEIELASESLGASWTRTMWHVVLPMARPGFVAAGVVVFTLTITDYAMPAIMGGGTNKMIANAIHDGFFSLSDAGLGGALSIILVAVATLIVGIVFTAVGVGTLGYARREA